MWASRILSSSRFADRQQPVEYPATAVPYEYVSVKYCLGTFRAGNDSPKKGHLTSKNDNLIAVQELCEHYKHSVVKFGSPTSPLFNLELGKLSLSARHYQLRALFMRRSRFHAKVGISAAQSLFVLSRREFSDRARTPVTFST